MVGLQVRGNETDALLEHLQRHAWLDPRALDAPADRNPVVTVECTQQSGLARAVVPMHYPAVACMDGK